MTKIINFQQFIKEGYTNKFNFELGKKYSYEELPKEVQSDIGVQFDEYDEENSIWDYVWKFKLMQPNEIAEYLESHFGNLDEALQHPYMRKIIRDIKKRGIDWPAVGIEGNHRALACWYLGIPLPYLEPIYKY
jgi:hypothetical protein